MATVYKEFIVELDVAQVWDALRDFGAVHTRLAPGFLTGCELDGQGARIVHFANGLVARELLVALDDENHRLAYTVTDGKATHHHASAQVFALGEGQSRFVWITDVLPDGLAAYIEPMMAHGGAAMKQTLERTQKSSSGSPT